MSYILCDNNLKYIKMSKSNIFLVNNYNLVFKNDPLKNKKTIKINFFESLFYELTCRRINSKKLL